VAYNHPEGYQRLSTALLIVLIMALISTFLWNAAIGQAQAKIGKYVEVEKLKECDQAIDSIEIPFMWQTILGVLILYIWALQSLHVIITV